MLSYECITIIHFSLISLRCPHHHICSKHSHLPLPISATIHTKTGATTVHVNSSSGDWGGDWGVVTNAAIDELIAQFSVTDPTQLANYIMFFLPFTMGGANADLGGAYSRFGASSTDEVWHEAGVLAHELGHNFGMGHSMLEGGSDKTCIMGVAPRETGPQWCFNGEKSWYLGWYNPRLQCCRWYLERKAHWSSRLHEWK